MRAAELGDVAPPDDPIVRRLRDAQDRAGLRGPLFVWGGLGVLSGPVVSFGGSRQSTRAGCSAIEALASALAARGACVASGGAIGADCAAHRGALERGGGTIVVLPAPIESIDLGAWRPALARHWRPDNSLFLSIFPRGARIDRSSPVLRNRLVAALAGAVVAGETGLSGGTNYLLQCARKLRTPVWYLSNPGADAKLEMALRGMEGWGAKPFTMDQATDPDLATGILAAASRPRAQEGEALSLFEDA